MSVTVDIIPFRKDNYSYILKADNGEVAVVDPGEAEPVIEALEKEGLVPDYVFCTHHHDDHIGGAGALKERYSSRIVGPEKEIARIPDMDIMLDDMSHFEFGGEKVEILETPGHTTGHICFYFPESGIVFTGDTLFLMSTGRLFEGTPEEMWVSLEKIMALPDETKIYCGHEYTLGGGQFCLTIEPDNEALKARVKKIKDLRSKGKPSIPGTIKEEKETNAFLRAGSARNYANIRAQKDAA